MPSKKIVIDLIDIVNLLKKKMCRNYDLNTCDECHINSSCSRWERKQKV